MGVDVGGVDLGGSTPSSSARICAAPVIAPRRLTAPLTSVTVPSGLILT
jgi:hypothetical protein